MKEGSRIVVREKLSKERELMLKLIEAQTLILELFIQITLRGDGIFDHHFIPIYQDAQKYLLKQNLIKKAQCYRI